MWSPARRHTSCMWHILAWFRTFIDHSWSIVSIYSNWWHYMFTAVSESKTQSCKLWLCSHLMPQTHIVSWPRMFFLPSGCCVYVNARCCHLPAVNTPSPDSACARSPAFISSFGSMQTLKDTKSAFTPKQLSGEIAIKRFTSWKSGFILHNEITESTCNQKFYLGNHPTEHNSERKWTTDTLQQEKGFC